MRRTTIDILVEVKRLLDRVGRNPDLADSADPDLHRLYLDARQYSPKLNDAIDAVRKHWKD